MRKAIYFLALLMILPVALSYQQNITSSSVFQSTYPQLSVVVLRYDPFPAEPGKYFDLWLQVENNGDLDAQNVDFKLMPSYPFSLDASETADRNFGTVLGHSSVLVKYKIRVDSGAVEGTSPVYYQYTTQTNATPVPGEVDVMVLTANTVLATESVGSEPSRIAPGEGANITIKFRNTANTDIKYLTVSLGLVTELPSSTGTTVVELPFTPLGEGNEKTINLLPGGGEAELSFNLVANPDASSGPYKIPLLINYYDNLGNLYNKSELVGIIVGSDPVLGAEIESSGVYGTGQPGDVNIKFVNRGVTNIKFLTATLNPSNDYKILSSDTQYIGKIDSDDYEVAKFTLSLNRVSDGKIILPITVDYADANNVRYTKDMNITLYVYSQKELGLSSSSGLGTIAIAIIIIAAAYLVYRRWLKKAKK